MTPAGARGLPIDQYIEGILETVEHNPVTVVVAPPGCGKTTRVPSALIDDPRRGRVTMLEPRRLAARSAAGRMATERGSRLGQEVGYRIRGEHRSSSSVSLDVVTDGLFLRHIQDQPDLEGVDVVVLDEFHERRLATDLALALCLDVQSQLRPDLRIVLMSATPDLDAVRHAVPDAAVVSVPARTFPVSVEHRPVGRGEKLVDSVGSAVRHIAGSTQGDILVFVPGRRDIEDCLARSASWRLPTVGLHGSMSPADQAAVLRRSDKRRVVVATNVAESSVTVEGVGAVIDTGLRKAPVRNATGLAPLRTVRTSRSSADQRAGRAGRERSGHVVRLWDELVQEQLAATDPPEIESADLDDLALQLVTWGVSPHDLTWMTPPDPDSYASSLAILHELGMTDSAGRPTNLGRTASRLGVSPRLARVVLDTTGAGNMAAAALATVIERDAPGDLRDLVAGELVSPSRETKRLARRLDRVDTSAGSPISIPAAVAAAFPELVARRRPDGRYLMACGKGAVGGAFADEWLAVTSVVGAGTDMRILTATDLDTSEIAAVGQTAQRVEVEWDSHSRRAHSHEIRHLGAIELSRVRRPPTMDELTRSLAGHIERNGLLSLDENDIIAQTLGRWNAVAPHVADMDPIDLDEICADLHWLHPFIKPRSRVNAGDIVDALLSHLGWDARAQLARLAPTILETPLGSERRIDWTTERPTLSAAVQEFFGCDEHPTVAAGAIRVTLELLSPARRPVQVTDDISRFWRHSYLDVRKDLRGRYPKHPWPEDPLSAKPWRPGRR
ncbi:MAG: ATP-dependent helicase HrpB [Actinomycetia bacterium]|nr:ATP-dependent helicase HrpB [Actinomycetes bacterium]